MGRSAGKILLKLDPTDKTHSPLKWHTIMKGSQFGGSTLASFELYVVSRISWCLILISRILIILKKT